MTFDEAVEAIERSFSDKLVDVVVSGAGDDGSPVAYLSGPLRRIRLDADAERQFAAAAGDVVGEEAAVFSIGKVFGNHISLWPSEFVSAEVGPVPPYIVVRMRDVVFHIGPHVRPGE